ncbi:hypothetical protein HY17_16700 [Hyphomonas sp. CY54-11-8]|nr:hypothetical protein HY17_16700 [Hyphomonas sp. CY54-11-8]
MLESVLLWAAAIMSALGYLETAMPVSKRQIIQAGCPVPIGGDICAPVVEIYDACMGQTNTQSAIICSHGSESLRRVASGHSKCDRAREQPHA